MGVVAEREQLLENLVRLRRAERAAPQNDDIRAVRRYLERAIGPTVKRAMAARALGVSQTALDRWISTGDVATVLTPEGRHEVPLGALIELVEAVGERSAAGEQKPLGAVLRERRRAAERLDAATILPVGSERRGHRAAELRSLAYHRAVAQRLDPRTVADARERLHRWQAAGQIHPGYAHEWEEILSRPPADIAAVISADIEPARALRQSSPFAGTLTEHERRRVLELVG